MNRNLVFFFIFFLLNAWAQAQTVSGVVLDKDTQQPMIGVAVGEKGTANGVSTDAQGKFKITPSQFPCVLQFFFVGSQSVELTFKKATDGVKVEMLSDEQMKVLDIQGEKIAEKIKQGPLTIESMDLTAIKQAATGNFYESLGSLKGVDLTTASLGFRIINTRGFNSTSPVRTLQIIDGVDNQSPGLNFSLGNFLGAPDLDVKGVEIIQGASSAYYGPGAFNGVVAMETKNPFLFKGFSFQRRVGERNLDEFAVRWADAIQNKKEEDVLAFKFNFYGLRAYDWEADNYDPADISPDKANNPGRWDAVNMYGDEYFPANDFSTSSPWNYKGLGTFYRTGYKEIDLVDYNTKNYKANGAVHWRLNPSLMEQSPELMIGGNVGGGTTVYQGDNRFSLRDILFYQGKVELSKKDKYFIRIYGTGENAGKSFDPYFTAMKLLNEARSNEDWAKVYTKYWNQYVNPKINALGYPDLEINPNWPGPVADPTYSQFYLPYDYEGLENWNAQYQDSLVAWHNTVAEMTNNGTAGIPMENTLGYYAPGTSQFDEAFQRITSAKNNSEEQGTRFSDRSALYNGQAQYQWDWSGWMMKAGASGRLYRPYSLGTIFSDTTERITTYEFGFYQGVEKHWWEDKIITTATLRVDKNKNFNWIWSPAASVVFKPIKDHYWRLSFSSALRNPTLTDQYLFLNVGPAILSGNLEGADSLITLDSFLDYRNSLDTDKLTYFSIDPLRPERVKSIELGYRGAFFNKLFVDWSGYYSIYDDFIGYNIGITSDFDPLTGLPSNIQVYRYAANSKNQVTTTGLSLGLHYYLNDHHTLNFNYSFNQLLKESEVFDPIIPAFNTPKHKFNIGINGEHLMEQTNGNDWGYSLNYKWIEGFLFEGSPQFTGMIPTYDLVDAQVNYQIKKANLNVKLGASNLMNNMQFQTYGGPRIGRLAYISLRYEFQKTK